MPLKVNEIFSSIQGESSFAGRPCVFVRLTGCNLRCAYCDTTFAYVEGEQMELSGIMARIRHYGVSLVEITGGEPLLQEETPLLIKGLLDEGYQVLLETNGSRDISRVDARCVKIVDIKGPSSGEMQQNDLKNLERLTPADELKFVIGDRNDYEFARGILNGLGLGRAVGRHIHFSPACGILEPRTLAAWILADNLPVRLQLQLHKVIWPAGMRGV